MWKIYDELIENIPEDLKVTSYVSGSNWSMVRSGDLCGTAMTVPGHKAIDNYPVDLENAKLKEVAAFAKSWNFKEASLGMAAINAYYNTMDNAHRLGHRDEKDEHGKNAFDYMIDSLSGKRVAMIGHFPNIERLAKNAEIKVLERDPGGDDYPDPACEYILPESDVVIITGSAFTNKTMPRLLQLSRNAMTCVVGPTTPISEILFDYGVDLVSGFCSLDADKTERVICAGTRRQLFRTGTMVNCERQ
ncbi:MAG: Rossmann-like domain-containing protein [Anaerovoracaceae bacterium]|jgi:uncharacterized protein (DUF4213/DUF364 family)